MYDYLDAYFLVYKADVDYGMASLQIVTSVNKLRGASFSHIYNCPHRHIKWFQHNLYESSAVLFCEYINQDQIG